MTPRTTRAALGFSAGSTSYSRMPLAVAEAVFLPWMVMGVPALTASVSVTVNGIASKSSAARISTVPPTSVVLNFMGFLLYR